MKNILLVLALSLAFSCVDAKTKIDPQKPSRTEIITPSHKESFSNNGECTTRKQGGNPRTIENCLVFDGSQDGNRQVDPQIAVGGGYVLHGTNNGFLIYDKEGNVIDGISQNCFKGGIDPKMFFDPHNQVFGFDLWVYWDKEKIKPVNISISETNDPRGAWNTYSIPSPKEVDGGAISYSRNWIAYSFPGGDENTFVMKMADAKAGKPTTVYHFKRSLGHPVAVQDAIDDMYFFAIERGDFVIRKVSEDKEGNPIASVVGRKAHNLKYTNYPPKSPQKNTEQVTSSGDRNPKNVVLQDGYIWFSHTINCNGKAAVQWHQVKKDGTIVQTGLIANENTNYIQTTLAVNKKRDVLIGFQETNENMYISPRMAFHSHKDKAGVVSKIIKLGEGKGATDGVAWGDYSGSVVDGDNLLDLWTVQSITNTKGKGETVIAKYPIKK
jgi:hypothetical protein